MKSPVVSAARCKAIISRYSRQSIMVIGDSMLDEYLWGNVTRISPEAPVPIVEINSCSLKLGGAANVACNLKALGIQTHLISICGKDANDKRLRAAMGAQDLPIDGILSSSHRPTTLKTRIIAQHQQIVRVDHEKPDPLTATECRTLLAMAIKRLDQISAVILSDYGKGVLCTEFLAPLIRECNSRDIFVAVDPKKRFFEDYEGAQLITPNLKEAQQALGLPHHQCTVEETKALGWKLLEKLTIPALLITMGEGGMALFERTPRRFSHLPTVARKVFDVTGAGDTVISVYTASRAAGATPLEAAFLANHAAGLSVAELGTATVKPGDLLRDCIG